LGCGDSFLFSIADGLDVTNRQKISKRIFLGEQIGAPNITQYRELKWFVQNLYGSLN